MRSVLVGTFAAAVLYAFLPVSAGAVQAGQTQPAQTETPAPKPHDMTGCLAKGETANTYKLTNVEGARAKTVDITETAANLKLDGHLGHKVTITGVAISPPKEEAGKKPAGEHYMRVDAVKHVSPTCP